MLGAAFTPLGHPPPGNPLRERDHDHATVVGGGLAVREARTSRRVSGVPAGVGATRLGAAPGRVVLGPGGDRRHARRSPGWPRAPSRPRPGRATLDTPGDWLEYVPGTREFLVEPGVRHEFLFHRRPRAGGVGERWRARSRRADSSSGPGRAVSRPRAPTQEKWTTTTSKGTSSKGTTTTSKGTTASAGGDPTATLVVTHQDTGATTSTTAAPRDPPPRPGRPGRPPPPGRCSASADDHDDGGHHDDRAGHHHDRAGHHHDRAGHHHDDERHDHHDAGVGTDPRPLSSCARPRQELKRVLVLGHSLGPGPGWCRGGGTSARVVGAASI